MAKKVSDVYKGLKKRIGRGWRLGLDGMHRTLGKFGSIDFPVILVGGTNGKGSVSFYIHEVLRSLGLKTGLSTSPHLTTPRERIVINGDVISEEDFSKIYQEIDLLDEEKATYFETLALMAIRHFQREEVDVAITEIGMGGRLDAFNALEPALCVVTNIGLEHTAYLGDTLEKIAAEKACIARRGCPAIVGDPLPSLRVELESHGARVHYIERNVEDSVVEHNINMALAAVEKMLAQLDRKFDRERSRELCRNAVWGGRFQALRDNTHHWILDAAHNAPAARELAAFLAKNYPDTHITALAAFMVDKDIAGIESALSGCVNEWVLTEVPDDRAACAQEILFSAAAERIPDLVQAFERVKSKSPEGGVILVTGSIYLIGELVEKGLITV